MQTYEYDSNSNITAYAETQDGTVINSSEYTYDALNRLTRLEDGGNIRMYIYDKNNNLTQVMDTSNDAANMIVSARGRGVWS